jgi:hypothetical protein
VKNHASSILSKLGVRDRTRAVLKALGAGGHLNRHIPSFALSSLAVSTCV